MTMESFGSSIQEYDVFEELGRGGFAVVYRAICRKSGMEVAIKMIDRLQIKAAKLSARVNQEVTIHSRLKHSSILQLFTFFEDDSYVYLVLELCRNGELQTYLKTHNRILSEPEACTIMKQIVEGLLYLHSHKIIHRDITLANLLLTNDMSIKIADFGLAIQLKWADQKQMTMCGTPNYISPEVATRGSHGLETDLWGLGIMLYTCLVGKPPFETANGLKSTLTMVVMSDIKFPAHVSVEAKDLIKALLKKNPKDRINLKNILDHPFILKSQTSSINGQLKRCMSYDSGVATASYMTPQPCNCYTEGRRSMTASVLGPEKSGTSKTGRKSAIVANINTASKISVPPISTKRLRPARQKTKNIVYSILNTSEVCLEFLRQIDGHERVWEVMRISSDGMRIIMYHPKKGKGVSVSECPPPLPTSGADTMYNYENIPQKHWQKYCYAHKFVNLVKRGTPKITYYSPLAKFQMMENVPDPDSKACFYEGGKICKAEASVTLSTASGNTWTFDIFDVPTFPTDIQYMWEHFRKCLDRCETLHQTMCGLGEGSDEVFPAVFGKRPQCQNSPLQASNRNQENLSPQSVINLPSMKGYESSIANTQLGFSKKVRYPTWS